MGLLVNYDFCFELNIIILSVWYFQIFALCLSKIEVWWPNVLHY